jgi:argininosuccinate lyase
LQALQNDVVMMTVNLPSGYHRELQLLKELLFPAFGDIIQCLDMAAFMLKHMEVNEDILADPKYAYLFSVDEVNKLVLNGVPFRDAYKQVGLAIEQKTFQPEKTIHHTHEGSMGNLGNDKITGAMDKLLETFDFEKVKKSVESLVS